MTLILLMISIQDNRHQVTRSNTRGIYRTGHGILKQNNISGARYMERASNPTYRLWDNGIGRKDGPLLFIEVCHVGSRTGAMCASL
jgi:hypothetical protein